ncbi:aspartate--tRNA ligase msd1 [Ophidiomyces ophidiicola]|nr:aspartate--tRNA ligase msd1 [Ophidiomyces ophidiicola]KAI2087534.1 aspartate--tRNA ligase msd1 [Ophidiomyces ophidiicola]KAI2168371.1 aspartate--tRNA ligase msd1 [Ophidiomyces ophidiicola]KAI2402700.1 aspartate--tRNA ligase msd1 [Ophidiomyces ophidiicola]
MYSQRLFHAGCPLATQEITSSPGPFLEEYKQSMLFPSAIPDFKFLLQSNAMDKEVTLHGYLGKRTDLGKKMSFVRLTDPSLAQTVQVVSFSKGEAFQKLRSIDSNSPVAVRGIIRSKAARSKSENVDPVIDAEGNIDSIEIVLEDIQRLNRFPRDIIMTPETIFPVEKRYLQIRNDKTLREALVFRAKANMVLRKALEECEPAFVEVETPLLFKSTPEGAREFLVPTRRPGLAYALPQSPQQYKQILMSSGIPRYYQFAHCFRDEDLRADRQPEFTQVSSAESKEESILIILIQLDFEMSFSRGEDVMAVIEQVIRKLWSAMLPEHLGSSPFPRVTYHEVMSKYGSDKPDPRIGMEIHRIDYMIPVDLVSKITDLREPIVEAIRLEGNGDPSETQKFIKSFMDSPAAGEFISNPEGEPGVFVFDSSKPLSGLQAFGFEATWALENDLNLKDGDLLVLQARRNAPFSGGSTPLGDLRRAIHRAAVENGFKPALTGFHFLWVTHFPLFSPSSDSEPGQGGSAGISSTHHPFTAPHTPEDVSLLLTDPTKAIADHYDLVVNGVELGGGSRRIHSAEVQEFILRDILKMSESRLADFSHLIDALRAGCPPHAGMALGFDRLIAVMLGKDSVRDVIAFPKSGKGEDVMVGTPSEITQEALQTYHLRLREDQL